MQILLYRPTSVRSVGNNLRLSLVCISNRLIYSFGIASLMINTGTVAKETVPSVIYESISCTEAMTVYKHAYLASGFRYKTKEALSNTVGSDTTPVTVLLHFDFPNMETPSKASASARLLFSTEFAEKRVEPSCRVLTSYVSGPDDPAYSAQEELAFIKIVMVARNKANVLVTEKLGKSVP